MTVFVPIVGIVRYAYWNNGGHLSFEDSLPSLYFEKRISVCTDKGVSYFATLTDEKVELTKAEINRLNNQMLRLENLRKEGFSDMELLLNKNENNFPYFSSLLADYKHYINLKYSNEIKNSKHPAVSSSKKVKSLSREIRALEKQNKILSYQMEIYESEFPWICDFKQLSIKEIEEIKTGYSDSESEASQLKEYISLKEYNSMPEAERYQLALDRYLKKHKTNWQIGISFERYVGYLYEKDGYHVTYFGAKSGIEDLGRDLIATKNGETLIIQCKYCLQFCLC